MNIKKGFAELIGNTPLCALENFSAEMGLSTPVVAKLERFNPAGSAKDRVAASMLLEAEKSGKLAPGGTVIEPTSGNTGVGLAALGGAMGYRVILVMPDTMSMERRSLLKAYGAQVELTPGAEGMAGAIERARQLNAEIPGSIIAGQFENPANPAAHEETTGPEIWRDTDGKVDIFVAGVGTGGTVTGVGKYLKKMNPEVKIVAVEPAGSPLLSEGRTGKHNLQGIGANFVPAVLERDVIDEIIPVSDEDAYAAGRLLAGREGILCGITSGAALHAAAQLAKLPENKGKLIVALLPDTGERYLSTAMFDR
ncbi:MAG: cysteine synthase A [Oscillospiraceae bacterium]|nr:cysteine synthase A [Oscillospiraceae bacterium]